MRWLTSTLLATTSVLLSCVIAEPAFRDRLPNARNVKTLDGEEICAAIGHKRCPGGGPANQFGHDFLKARMVWTKSLCEMDSDNDGRTNGQELGDPECTWKRGDPDPVVEQVITSPGHWDDFEGTLDDDYDEYDEQVPAPKADL